jgi:hypothetical protein
MRYPRYGCTCSCDLKKAPAHWKTGAVFMIDHCDFRTPRTSLVDARRLRTFNQ